MKKPRCPSCNKPIARTIEIIAKGVRIYSMNMANLGPMYPCDWSMGYNLLKDVRKVKDKQFIAFRCRRCSNLFPESMNLDIATYLNQDKVIHKLTDS